MPKFLSEEEFERQKRIHKIVKDKHDKRAEDYLEAVRTHPCSREKDMSMQCLEDQGYDREKCVLHFENYRNCQKFWNKVSWDRWRKGIEPSMPPPAERPAIQKEYAKKLGYG